MIRLAILPLSIALSLCVQLAAPTDGNADTLESLASIDAELGFTMGGLRLASGHEVLQARTSGLDLEFSYPMAERSRLFVNMGLRAGVLASSSRGQNRALAPQSTLGLVSLDLGGQQPIGDTKWMVDVGLGINAAAISTSMSFSYSDVGVQAGAGISRWFEVSDSFRIGAKLRTKVLSLRDVRDRYTGQSVELSLSAGYW